jgi:hypothetical protein
MRSIPQGCVALMLMAATSVSHAGSDLIFAAGFEPYYGFTVVTPTIAAPPGTSATYCYYFNSPNAAALGIKRWASTMTAAVHHLILFATYDGGWAPSERQPPGTLTQIPCGFSEGGGNAAWMYAAHEPSDALVLPTDDGGGTPLAMEVAPAQPMFVQMYVRNAGNTPLNAAVVLTADALAPSDVYTKTASYLEANLALSIPPQSSGWVAQQTCATPAGVKFWWLSTRTHRFATQASILDAASPLVVSTDWEHPAIANFDPPAFFSFSPSGMTYQCVYDNPTGAPLQAGESETSSESCIGIGYFVPASRPSLCIGDLGPL